MRMIVTHNKRETVSTDSIFTNIEVNKYKWKHTG